MMIIIKIGRQAMESKCQTGKLLEYDWKTGRSMECDWQTGKSLAECNRYMLTHQVASDITFCIGPNLEKVHAHKYVLSSRSSVFYAMLYGPMASSEEIHITDIEIDAFQCFLRYIYTEEAELTGDNVLAVMHAANKYAMTRLEAKCVDFLMDNLSSENVCAALECAHCFSRKELHNHCIEFIKDNPGAFESEHFMKLCKECLSLVIQMDELIIQEEDLFESVMRWATTQCTSQGIECTDTSRQHILKDLLPFIRFPVMSQKFFTENVVDRGLLSTDETVEIIKQMSGDEVINQKFMNRKRFGTDQYICKRFSYDRTDVRWERKTGRIDFYVDTHILITGLVLYSKYFNSSVTSETDSIEVYAALENSDSDIVLTEVWKTVKPPKDCSVFKVKFPKCIRLDPDIRYSVYVQKDGCYSNWGDGGMASVVSEGINFYFLTTYKSEQTNRAKGLLPGIIFCKMNHMY